MRKLVFVIQVAFVQYDLDLTRARLHKQLKVKWQPFVPEDFLQCGKNTSTEVTNIGDAKRVQAIIRNMENSCRIFSRNLKLIYTTGPWGR